MGSIPSCGQVQRWKKAADVRILPVRNVFVVRKVQSENTLNAAKAKITAILRKVVKN